MAERAWLLSMHPVAYIYGQESECVAPESPRKIWCHASNSSESQAMMLASMSQSHYNTFPSISPAAHRCIALAGPHGHVLLPALLSTTHASEETDIKRILDRTAFSSRADDSHVPRAETLPAFAEITAGLTALPPLAAPALPALLAPAERAAEMSSNAAAAVSAAVGAAGAAMSAAPVLQTRPASPADTPQRPESASGPVRKRRSKEAALPIERRRRYICKTCNKGFTTSGHLARHNRIHTGEKNHVCPFEGCGQRFSRHDNCVQHYKTHVRRSV